MLAKGQVFTSPRAENTVRERAVVYVTLLEVIIHQNGEKRYVNRQIENFIIYMNNNSFSIKVQITKLKRGCIDNVPYMSDI